MSVKCVDRASGSRGPCAKNALWGGDHAEDGRYVSDPDPGADFTSSGNLGNAFEGDTGPETHIRDRL
jgi:hypothetical protein